MEKETKIVINRYALKQKYSVISDIIKSLELLIEGKTDRDFAHVLLDGNVLLEWLQLASLVSELVKENDGDEIAPPLDCTLRIHKLYSLISELGDKFENVTQNVARQYGDNSIYKSVKGSHIEKQWHALMYDDNNDCVMDDFTEEGSFSSCIQNMSIMCFKIKNEIYHVSSYINDMASVCKLILRPVSPNRNDYATIIENGLREYSMINENKIMSQLILQAQLYKKNRADHLNYETWGILMEKEHKILELVIHDGPAECIEENFESISNIKVENLKDNKLMIRKILETSVDEKMYNIKYAVTCDADLLSVIDAENINLFYQLILRRNLIQSEMFQTVKAEYKDYLAEKDTLTKMACNIEDNMYNAHTFDNLKKIMPQIFHNNESLFKKYVEDIAEVARVMQKGQGATKTWNLVYRVMIDDKLIQKCSANQFGKALFEVCIAKEISEWPSAKSIADQVRDRKTNPNTTGYRGWDDADDTNDKTICIEIARYFNNIFTEIAPHLKIRENS